ncbi:hypothetical protein HMPREF2811_06815 [Globicatella sp. HMSC072A10]|uniref:glycoside hydrolase family 31 protein n=1 Tax=Globicatella sp. HMSC072A10 TaxID=1739315 RepID=UPI0008B9B10B|nr:TIM-barrel domain-containing protein [Globicatella sp. HMSC072A10]OFK57024.1 hypothetical protein HMPREF2811_06815 [Globicatella sp. HMSC072A10]
MYKKYYEEYNPVAPKKSIVQGNKFRFTILTSKLIRLEYSEENIFEDSQTKMVLNRDFKTPKFQVYDSENRIKIVTDDLILKYDKQKFSPYGLSIELNGKVNHPYRGIWHYGDITKNLGGTARTLDFADGAVELEPGLMSKYGISMLDDSNTPVFKSDGWYKKRESNQIDIYIFGYKNDYFQALDDFYQLTGPQPKLPRYTLGNWWSRYYPYSEDSYVALMDRFQDEKIPFSVSVIDMDWHLVDIPDEYGSKWTGYTWNNELFPNPKRFLERLKQRNLATTLNIHPSSGIRPFEDMYEVMASDLKIDTENKEYIDFLPDSQKFMESTFKHIYHPNEEIGVDFWWVDWQQGPHSIDESVDPLWVLNHYHYNDNQKDNNLGITLSRYSGPGSHRYPIGFSGDTVISWDSLDFQPYFTATASNIGYGWWSHDVGGHRHGIRDDELMLRWLQFGVFSPINRLHSADSEFLMKEPWSYGPPIGDLMREYLRIRHKLVPYIYTMNILSNKKNLPLIQPMYYKYPENENSYNVPNQYYFGSEIIVAPITKKIDKESLLGKFKIWLPEGNWYDLQSGLKYSGDRNINIFRPIERLGLFLKEGSIIPLANLDEFTNSIENPEHLELIIGSGDSGEFNLLEDYTGKENVEKGMSTLIEFDNSNNKISIYGGEGNIKVVPHFRTWKIKLYGVKVVDATICQNDSYIRAEIDYDESLNISTIQTTSMDVKNKFDIYFDTSDNLDMNNFKVEKMLNILKAAQIQNKDKEILYGIIKTDCTIEQKISNLISYSIGNNIINPLLEIILA